MGVLPVVNEEDIGSGSEVYSLVEEPARCQLPLTSSDSGSDGIGLDSVDPIGGEEEEKKGDEERVVTENTVSPGLSLSQFAHQNKAVVERRLDRQQALVDAQETASAVLKETLMSLHGRDESTLSTATDDTVIVRQDE